MEIGDALVALVTLTAMEVVLGIDNVIFIAIVAGRLPRDQQPRARRVGLAVALLTRLLLLALLFVLTHLDSVVVFTFSGLGLPRRGLAEEVDAVTVKDLVLLAGGLFLIAKSVVEIHHKLEGDDEAHASTAPASFASIIAQIAVLDIVFSLDSVITAVGMVRAESATDFRALGVMVAAVVIAVAVMMLAAGRISDFVSRHPTVKVLALAFLILIGVMLVAE